MNDIEEIIKEEIEYKLKQFNPMSEEEIAIFREDCNNDKYYIDKAKEQIKKAKNKSNRLFKKNVKWGVMMGAVMGALYFGVKSYKKPQNDIQLQTKK